MIDSMLAAGAATSRSLPRHGAGLLAAVLLSWVLAGCGSDDDSSAPMDQASATIGAAGGTVDGPDGVRVVVPPGALAAPTTIRIARSATGAPADAPDGYGPLGAVYEFTPHGLNFAVPVTISMPAPSSVDPQAFTARSDDGWSLVAAATEAGRMAWVVPSFSWFTIAACSPRAGDPYPCYWPRMTPDLTANPSTAVTPLDTQQAGGVQVLRWQVTQAASLRMALELTAAADCKRDARLTIRPGQVVNGLLQYGDPVLERDLVMLPDPANDKRSRTSVNWDLSFARPDNGTHRYWLSLRCTREFTGGRSAIDGYAQFVVDVGPLPAITSQPADASVVAPGTASFSVVASGAPAPTLQWQRSGDGGVNWIDLPGANAASYTTPPTSLADDGSLFRAVARNAAGSVASDTARLSVAAPLAGQWYPAGPVDATGNNTFGPSVGVDAAGRALAVWNALPPGASVSRTYFATATAGQPWSAPQAIDVGATNGYDVRIAVAPDGRAVAAWGYRSGSAYRLAASTFDGSQWSAPQRLDTAYSGNTTEHAVGIDASGRAAVVFAQYDTTSTLRVFTTIGASGNWSAPQHVDRGSPAGQVAIAVNGQGRGFAVFTDGSAGAYSLAAASLDLAAGSIGTARSVREGSRALGARGLAVDATGAALLVWVDDSSLGYSVRWSRYAPAGDRWSDWADLTGQDDTLPSADQFSVAGGANGDAVVVWRHSRYGTPGAVAVVSSQWRNGAWSPLQRHSQGRDADRPRAAANANGRLALSWLHYDGNIYSVWGRIFDGTAWRPAQALQRHVREVPTREPYALGIGDGDHAAVLWAEYPESGSGANGLEGAFFAP